MPLTPTQFPAIIDAIAKLIDDNADRVTELDQAIGDGDHVYNLRRGLDALRGKKAEIAASPDWSAAWQTIGMTIMSSIGGASGSLYATLFLSLAKQTRDQSTNPACFARAFRGAIDAVKQRGKADVGEKTMLDVWIPVANTLLEGIDADKSLSIVLDDVCKSAERGVESTRDMIATKGRASFLGERSKGHIDAGAQTAQLMIEAIVSAVKPL